MTDLIAQYLFLMFLLLCIKHRGILIDITDGNVERLEREEKRYQEALWWINEVDRSVKLPLNGWLSNMKERKV